MPQGKVIVPVSIIGLIIIVAIVFAVVKPPRRATASQVVTIVPSTSSAASPASTATTPTPASTRYNNGSYEATGTYVSPGGSQKIDVSLTVSGDTITAVSVTPEGVDRESRQYESFFAAGISQIVVGKPLAGSFDVSEVNGSSLTGIGFTKALAAIRAKAAA